MEIYAPEYYLDFKCIADKCRHSCCVDWEIRIDDFAYKKYENLKGEFGNQLRKNIVSCDGSRVFKLDESNRCPNLDERGLCRIISKLGENYLCEICSLHPRFFFKYGTHLEMGIGLSCEEAVRVVMNSKKLFKLVKIGENEEEYIPEESSFSVPNTADDIIKIIEREDNPLQKKIEEVCKKYKIPPEPYSLNEWIDIMLSFDILDEKWRKMLEKSKNADKINDISIYNEYFENLYKYFVFRHVKSCDNECELRARIAFSSLAVKFISYLAEREPSLTVDKLFDIIRMYSSEIEYSEENTESVIFEYETAFI